MLRADGLNGSGGTVTARNGHTLTGALLVLAAVASVNDTDCRYLIPDPEGASAADTRRVTIPCYPAFQTPARLKIRLASEATQPKKTRSPKIPTRDAEQPHP